MNNANATGFLKAISSVYNKYKIRDAARASLQRHLTRISSLGKKSDIDNEIKKLEKKIEEVIAIERQLMGFDKREGIAIKDIGDRLKSIEEIVISRLPQGKARVKRVKELERKIKKKAKQASLKHHRNPTTLHYRPEFAHPMGSSRISGIPEKDNS